MLIIALVLAVIGLAALVTAVVTSNELIAWVCIAASVIGVVLLIVDAVRERASGESSHTAEDSDVVEDYPEDEAHEPAESDDDTETTVVAQAAEDADEDVVDEDRSR
jgi:hypothetical protein